MNGKSVFAFAMLFCCFLFFIWMDVTIFWIVVSGIVAFAYYVIFANYFKDLGKKEREVKNKNV